MRSTLLWLRRDLRLCDNPALEAALQAGDPIIPLFVLDETPSLRPVGAASLWWLDKSLAALSADLEARGSRLILRRGVASDIIDQLVETHNVGRLVFNAIFDPGFEDRDRTLAASLQAKGVEVRRFNGGHLVNPDDVRTKTDGAFSVFTPFWRAARTLVQPDHPRTPPPILVSPLNWPDSDQRADWHLHPNAPDWSGGFCEWTPGEVGAAENLSRFIDQALVSYAQDRDRPSVEGTSRLSPHLHFGEISPKACWRAVFAAAARGDCPDSQVDKFLAELGWREFSTSLVTRRGDLAHDNFDPRFDRFAWRNDPAAFGAWTRGQTGYPVVDAGMRQLWATGWMHNRVRMICASFLTKHLLVDWRQGEAWFWDTLVDADHAANAGNWQWVAGSGADASPYFRIFNPMIQGEKFDPEGTYVRAWVPELARLSPKYIHAPWTAPSAVLAGSGVQLGVTYPHPIVDHAQARQHALDAYAQMRGTAAAD